MEQEDPTENVRDYKFLLALSSITILNLSTAFDATCISVALPSLAKSLHGNATDAFWCGTAFLLTNTVFQPTWVSISDAFGRRAALLAGTALFAIGSAICGAAYGFPQLLTGRTIQGMGGASIMCLSEVIITDMVPLSQRPKYIIFVTAAWALGSNIGPVIGGAIIEHSSWRWLFLAPLPPTVVGFVMVFLFLRLNQRNENVVAKLKRIDYIGSFLFIGSLTSALLGITWGGVMYPWSSVRTIVPICVGVVGLVVTMAYETYITRKGRSTIVTVDIFRTVTACANYYNTFIHGICMWLGLYYLPLYFEGVKQFGPVHSGIAIFSITLSVVPVSIVTSAVIRRTQSYRWAQWFGWPIAVLGSGLNYTLDVRTKEAQWVLYPLIVGIGIGCVLPALAIANMASAPSKSIATAAGMVPFFRSMGQMMGVAMGGAIFQNQFKSRLEVTPGLSEIARRYASDATAVVELLRSLPTSPTKSAVQSAFAHGLKPVWLFQLGITASAMGCSALLWGYTMDRKPITDHGWEQKNMHVETGNVQNERRTSKDSIVADSLLVAKVPWSQAADDSHSVWRRDIQPSESRSSSFSRSVSPRPVEPRLHDLSRNTSPRPFESRVASLSRTASPCPNESRVVSLSSNVSPRPVESRAVGISRNASPQRRDSRAYSFSSNISPRTSL